MPLTEKGQHIKSAMEEFYGKGKGEKVFYASANAGKITGVHDDDCRGYHDAARRGDAVQMQLHRSRMIGRR